MSRCDTGLFLVSREDSQKQLNGSSIFILIELEVVLKYLLQIEYCEFKMPGTKQQ